MVLIRSPITGGFVYCDVEKLGVCVSRCDDGFEICMASAALPGDRYECILSKRRCVEKCYARYCREVESNG